MPVLARELGATTRNYQGIVDSYAFGVRRSAPGLRDELATVIRMLHGRLGLDEGGMR